MNKGESILRRVKIFREDARDFSVMSRSCAAIFVVLGCLAAILSMSQPAEAMPAYRGTIFYEQPDGARFGVNQDGDEIFSYVKTLEGYLIQESPNDGIWRYIVDDGNGMYLGERADGAHPNGAVFADVLSDEAQKAAYAALGGEAYPRISYDDRTLVTLDDLRSTQGSPLVRSARSAVAETTLPLITIVIGFAGDANDCTWKPETQRYSTTFDWAQRLYTGESSVTNYYRTMSNGKFAWVPADDETSAYGEEGNTNVADKAGDGIVHVTVSGDHGNWRLPDNEESIARLHVVYAEALEEAADFIDFSAYDANGDGVLSTDEAGLLFVVAGYESAFSQDETPSTWAHSWQLASQVEGGAVEVDGVLVSDYVTMGETVIQTQTIGGTERKVDIPTWTSTLCHELGHYLGLADLYDTTYDGYSPWSAYGVEGLSIMAYGGWGGYIDEATNALEYLPASFDPHSLVLLGYVEPEEIVADGTYRATSLTDTEGYALFSVQTDNPDEYYLIENRQYESFDRGLKRFYGDSESPGVFSAQYPFSNPTGGIVVWHVDEGICRLLYDDNSVNQPTHRPGIMPVYFEDANLNDGFPLIFNPFLTNATMTEFLGAEPLELLLYNGRNEQADRVESGIEVRVEVPGSTSMEFTVNLPDPTVDPNPAVDPDPVVDPDSGQHELAVDAEDEADGESVTMKALSSKMAATGDPLGGIVGIALVATVAAALVGRRLRE